MRNISKHELGKIRKEVVVASSSMRTFFVNMKEKLQKKKYSVAISVQIFEDRTNYIRDVVANNNPTT
jgi:hypothetical protein